MTRNEKAGLLASFRKVREDFINQRRYLCAVVDHLIKETRRVEGRIRRTRVADEEPTP